MQNPKIRRQKLKEKAEREHKRARLLWKLKQYRKKARRSRLTRLKQHKRSSQKKQNISCYQMASKQLLINGRFTTLQSRILLKRNELKQRIRKMRLFGKIDAVLNKLNIFG